MSLSPPPRCRRSGSVTGEGTAQALNTASRSPWRVVPITASAVSIFTGCADLQSSLSPAGPQAARISALWWLMFWVLATVMLIVLSVLVGGTVIGWIKRRHEPGASDADHVVAPGVERGTVLTVTVAVVLTTIVLGVLLAASVRTGRALNSLRGSDAVTVELIGHLWWWEARYFDPASDTLVLANEIHVPVGRPVRITGTSVDVIHSFWAPNLHGKRDLIPGHTMEIWLQADREGVFPAQCAEYCGLQHAHMRLVIVAEPPERFASWLTAQRQAASAPATDSQRRGQQVFLSQCAICHTVRGTSAAGQLAPDLTHFGSRLTIAAGTLPNNRGHLAGWVANPQGVKPGALMPPTSVNSADLLAVVDYLGSLR
jgi:cytochrome c oxidase subunit 2